MADEEKAQLKAENAHLSRISETSALADLEITLLELALTSEAETSRGDVVGDEAIHRSMAVGRDRSEGVLDRERERWATDPPNLSGGRSGSPRFFDASQQRRVK